MTFHVLLLTPGPLTTSRSVKDVILQDHCTQDHDSNRVVTDSIATHLSTLPIQDVFEEHLPPLLRRYWSGPWPHTAASYRRVECVHYCQSYGCSFVEMRPMAKKDDARLVEKRSIIPRHLVPPAPGLKS